MMYHESDLRFLDSTLRYLHLQTLRIQPQGERGIPDLGLRDFFGLSGEYQEMWQVIFDTVRPNIIYQICDHFLFHYIFFQLPDSGEMFFIGPYLEMELTEEQIRELSGQWDLPVRSMAELLDFYSKVPVISQASTLLAPLSAFAEALWGGSDAYTFLDLNQELFDTTLTLTMRDRAASSGDSSRSMQIMEMRYAYENELLDAITHGLTQKAEMLLSVFSSLSFEKRLADPVRNIKNYCIIMNTLLRKAAEQGGVHPIYLDSLSSRFARQIEELPTLAAGRELMGDMARSYCRLVNRCRPQQYSPPIQKVLVRINSDLSGDLSLKTLADEQNINASYLSSLFRRETNQTLTDYVNQRRIALAVQLLGSTQLQVQTIAQHCGFPDVNYFSKTFKKHVGKTPKEYRKSAQLHTEK